jgi:hypothetical protein
VKQEQLMVNPVLFLLVLSELFSALIENMPTYVPMERLGINPFSSLLVAFFQSN